jgi:putative sigma-54 modulation protein
MDYDAMMAAKGSETNSNWRKDLLIHVRGKNASLEDGLQEYAEAELQKLNKYSLGELISASVSFTGKASRNPERASRVEVVLFGPRHSFHAEENGNSPEAAFDVALEKLKQQLKKAKEKRTDKTKHQPKLAEVANSSGAAYAPEPSTNGHGPQLLVEKFTIKPMGIREAVLQLDKARRDFFVFVGEQNQIHAVYKRPDGNIGLLVPENELDEI